MNNQLIKSADIPQYFEFANQQTKLLSIDWQTKPLSSSINYEGLIQHTIEEEDSSYAAIFGFSILSLPYFFS